MKTIKFIINKYSSTGDGTWSASPTLLTGHYGVSVKKALGASNDVFSFMITNVSGGNNNYSRKSEFNPMDRLEIHLSINNAAASSGNMLMNGLIKKVTETVTGKGIVLKIDGKSFDEILTNGLVFASRVNNVNVMEFIEAAINSVKLRNANFGINFTASSVNGNGKKRDGTTSFPVLNSGNKVSEFDKRLVDILEKYLQNDYTEDGRYLYFVDTDKVLHIKPRLGGSLTGSRTEGVDMKSIKYNINADDVKNFVVVKCGFDAYNKPITTRYDDPVSRAKFGFKYYMLVDGKISGDLISAEISANPSLFDDNSKVPNAYNYTTQWGAVCTNANDFNDKLRVEAKRVGVAKAEEFVAIRDKGYITINTTEVPNLDFAVGDKMQLTSVSYGLTEYDFRVNEIIYDINSTNYILKEEVASI